MKRWRELMEEAPRLACVPAVDAIGCVYAAVTSEVGWPFLKGLRGDRWGWQPRCDFAWLGWNLTTASFDEMGELLGLSGATIGQDFRRGRDAGWIERRVRQAEFADDTFGGGLLWLPIS